MVEERLIDADLRHGTPKNSIDQTTSLLSSDDASLIYKLKPDFTFESLKMESSDEGCSSKLREND